MRRRRTGLQGPASRGSEYAKVRRNQEMWALEAANAKLRDALEEVANYEETFGGPPPDDAMRGIACEALGRQNGVVVTHVVG